MKMTGERGVDTAIEAVGIPATFELRKNRRAGRHNRKYRSAWNESGSPSGAPLGP
jgi:hypothetical protein